MIYLVDEDGMPVAPLVPQDDYPEEMTTYTYLGRIFEIIIEEELGPWKRINEMSRLMQRRKPTVK